MKREGEFLFENLLGLKKKKTDKLTINKMQKLATLIGKKSKQKQIEKKTGKKLEQKIKRKSRQQKQIPIKTKH